MTFFSWLRVLGATLSVLLAFNGVVAKFGRSQGEEMLRGLPVRGDYEQLFLGNSTMARGFDAKVYAQAAGIPESKVLKLALGGVSAEEECLLLEEFFAKGNKVKQVVLGFHDLNLEGVGPHSWSSLSGAMNLIYFVPHERAQQVYQLTPTESLKVRLTRWVPMLVRRSNLWARVEQLRRRLETIGMTEQKVSVDGRVKDFHFYPYLESEREKVHTVIQSLVLSGAALSAPLQRMIDVCRQNGVKLSVMEMPLKPERVALCESDSRWVDYRELRRSLLSSAKVSWHSFLKWAEDEDFVDPVHMTEEGAAGFSRKLAAAKFFSTLP